jgi:hypothetical protein
MFPSSKNTMHHHAPLISAGSLFNRPQHTAFELIRAGKQLFFLGRYFLGPDIF